MKKYQQFNELDWIRTCQECNHKQVDIIIIRRNENV